MNDNLRIYRRRLIPSECIPLKDDVIVEQSDEHIVTKWTTLRPKQGFAHGCSCYFLREGIKVSKMYRADGSLVYWYCDIVDYSFDPEGTSLTVTDLLVDVILYPDGRTEVVDLNELAEAMEQGLITGEQVSSCLRSLDRLLAALYRKDFGKLKARLENLGL